uniref:Heterokaryon incompatibility domain-containing protein n=1 Tax=Tetraselmis sp. GSL018 TaxID=582737 RepID=A0A061S613_9CHLO
MLKPSSDVVSKWSPKTALRGVVLLQLITKCLVIPVAWLSPCDFLEVVKGSKRCSSYHNQVLYISFACFVWGTSVLFYDYPAKLFCIWRLRRAQLRVEKFGQSDGGDSLDADHWVVGANRSFFLETSESVKTARALTVLLQGLLIPVFFCREMPFSRQDFFRGVHDVAGENGELSQLAIVSREWKNAVVQASWTVFLMPLLVILSMPTVLWSRVTEKAARECSDSGLQRMFLLPWLSFPLMLLNGLLVIAAYFIPWVENDRHSGLAMEIWFILNAVAFVGCVALLVWSRLLPDTVSVVRTCKMGLRFAQGLRRTARLLHCRVSPYPESLPVRMGSMTELTGAGHEWQRHMDSSAHQQELVVLYTCIFLWCSPEGTSAVSFSVLYASRLLAAGLLLLTRDRGYSVCAMRSQGAALGLLMDARRLARAIQGHLAGRPPAGPVPAYKATVLRMHRTLAVSYRWQPEEREVAEGVSVNMSDFQLRSLAAAVRSSGCDYVWIDKLAVPQDGGSLQRTILSRMLAVYCGAHTTLVLRTAEGGDEDRYHRRAWTVQEFCCSRELLIVTEPTDEGVGRFALDPEEEAYFVRLREEVQRSLAFCRPYWLCDPRRPLLQPDEARDAVARYTALAARTACKKPSDKVRALCPLLVNIPVENHRELVELVRVIAEKAAEGGAGGLEEPELANLALFASQPIVPRHRSREALVALPSGLPCSTKAW